MIDDIDDMIKEMIIHDDMIKLRSYSSAWPTQ